MKAIYKWLAIIVVATNLVVSGNSQTTFGKHEIAKPFTRSAGLALADPDQDGDLADLTIRCINYINSANILNHREDMTNNVVNPSSVFIIGSGTSSRIAVKAIPGEHLYIRLLDINGRILYPRYQGPMIGPYMELPLNSNDVSLSSGIYVVTVTGSLSGTNSIRILYQ
jgi:hypothetical protein